jgi:hypothetical protein
MKTFYSIVYATIRPDISEKLSLGLIFVSNNKVYFRFSIHKTNLLKHLLPAGPLKSIKLGLKNINSKLNKSQASANDASIITFDNTVNQAEFSLSYLDYLSNYNNNLITFSKPALIDVEINDEVFNVFFKKFVDDSFEETPKTENKKFELFRKSYFQKVSKQFNIEQKLTSNEIPNLLLPVKFDLVGKNEREVVAEFVNTEKPVSTISHQVNNFYAFKDAVPNSKRFLVSIEPDKKLFPEQHSIWINLFKEKNLATYIDQKDVALIDAYAKEHGVEPLLKSKI